MPTPTGMLKHGDLIRHTHEQVICEVIERLGNDLLFSVRLKRADGKPFPGNKPTVLMTEAGWHIKHDWEVIQ